MIRRWIKSIVKEAIREANEVKLKDVIGEISVGNSVKSTEMKARL